MIPFDDATLENTVVGDHPERCWENDENGRWLGASPTMGLNYGGTTPAHSEYHFWGHPQMMAVHQRQR